MASDKVYKTRKNVDLPTRDLEWLDNAYPDFPLSACLAMLLVNFRAIHEDTGVTPNKVARDAAKELRESLGEGIIDGVEYRGGER